VPEVAAYLAGAIDLAEAQVRGAQATRNYAKRQFTWFRNQSPPDWPRSLSENCNTESTFALLLRT